jgi:hypothetical protein
MMLAMSELLQSAEFAGQATDQARAVVIGGTRLFSFLYRRHSIDRSLERKTRLSAERKSESRAVVAERKDTCAGGLARIADMPQSHRPAE